MCWKVEGQFRLRLLRDFLPWAIFPSGRQIHSELRRRYGPTENVDFSEVELTPVGTVLPWAIEIKAENSLSFPVVGSNDGLPKTNPRCRAASGVLEQSQMVAAPSASNSRIMSNCANKTTRCACKKPGAATSVPGE